MTIEFTNATPPKGQSGLSVALLVLSCLFFFIPVSLIVLGYYTSLPTGTLISPVPQGVMSAVPPITAQTPIVAAPESSISSATSSTASNSTQKIATVPANLTNATVSDPDILFNSQIYLINQNGDKSLYTVKNKSLGQFEIESNSVSNLNRSIDYQIVNP